MPIPPDPVLSLKRIETWIARNHPDRMPFVRRGADSRTLQRVEDKFGKPLPSDIRLLYAAHDGQPEGAPALYLNQRWLPLDLVAVAWEDICLRHGVGEELRQEAHGDGGRLVQTESWSANWLPLFGSPSGDHYCIDLGWPETTRRYGQVIWFLYDQIERTILARNMREFLWRVANGLDAGNWRLDDGYDGLSD